MQFARPRPRRFSARSLALASSLLALASATTAQSAWVVGRPVPDLRLPTIQGETSSLADLRGERVLLLEFASW